jgi:hypothetical protein
VVFSCFSISSSFFTILLYLYLLCIRGSHLGIARLYGTKSLVIKIQVDPIGHIIKVFSAACLQTEPSSHSSFCLIVCFIFAGDSSESLSSFSADAILSDNRKIEQVKSARSIVTIRDESTFMVTVKDTKYIRNSLKSL